MKAVVILSGGMDSTTLLYDVISQGYQVEVLSFNYGQRHKKELEFAKKTCEKLGVNQKIVDITAINDLVQGSALTSDIAVPEGHYAQENMKLTVVPNRNMIMLSLAVGYAVSKEANTVFFGAHAGDHFQYPDCRIEFIQQLSELTKIANFIPVEVKAPYSLMDKGDIAIKGTQLGVDYALSWTCYAGQERPCLRCGADCERTQAFQKANRQDPLLTDSEWKLAVEYSNKFTEEYNAQRNINN